MKITKIILLPNIILCVLFAPLPALAEETLRRYKTPEERREAGQGHELTEWLKITPLVEFETSVLRTTPVESVAYNIHERDKIAQFEIELEPSEWFNAQFNYEYDNQLNKLVRDEALAEFIAGDFKLELGNLYVPFGEYFSSFTSGPIIEAAETQARAVVFAYEPDDQFEVSLFVFKSRIEKNMPKNNSHDWGFSLNVKIPNGFSRNEITSGEISMGLSYLSDLAEAEEGFIEETSYRKKVDALSTYINIEQDGYGFSFELVGALHNFAELESQSNHPFAWNMELVFYPVENFQWAFRLEGSRELEDAPEFQTGLAATWYISQWVSITADVLHGRFKSGFVENDQEQLLESQNQLAAQLSMSF